MFYYIKMAGDDPIIVECDLTINDFISQETIRAKTSQVHFLIQVMTQQGQGTIPISAEDNGLGLKDSEIHIISKNISIISQLSENSEIIEAIRKMKLSKSGIVTPQKSKLII